MGVLAQAPPQPPSDPTAGGNQSPGGPTGTPIEGGLGILLMLAGGYAVRKIRKISQATGE